MVYLDRSLCGLAVPLRELTVCWMCMCVLQMLSALSDAGLGPQEVEHLWACYEKAKAAEDKAGFNTGQHTSVNPWCSPPLLFCCQAWCQWRWPGCSRPVAT